MKQEVLLTASEIHYLNNILDNQNIYGIYMAQSFIEKQLNRINEENSLITKGILNRDKSINEKNITVIENLQQYKNSKEYISINDIIFSVNENNKYSILLKNINAKYTFEKILKSDIIHELTKKFPFLDGNNEEDREVYKLEFLDVVNEKLIKVGEDEWFSIKKNSSKTPSISYVFFMYENKTYKYDRLKRELEKLSSKEIRKELSEIFYTTI